MNGIGFRGMVKFKFKFRAVPSVMSQLASATTLVLKLNFFYGLGLHVYRSI